MESVIIFGIISGSLYALTGTGLVLVYRSSRVLNFALGGIGSLAAYVVFSLSHSGLPVGVELVIAMAVGVVGGAAVETFLIRPLGQAPPMILGVSTIGALLIFQGAIESTWGSGVKALHAVGGSGQIKIVGTIVTWNDIVTVALSLAMTGAVLLMIGKTWRGLAMRAASAGPVTATLLGVDVASSRRLSWAVGGACGALAAFLILPLTYLSPTNFTSFTLVAFAAVVLGGFTSLNGVLIGSFVFGIGLNLIELYLSTALTNTFVLVAITIILLFRPHGLFGLQERLVAEPSLPMPGRPRRSSRWLKKLRWRVGSVATGAPSMTSRSGTKKQDAIGVGVVALAVLAVGLFGGGTMQYEAASALAVYIAIVGLRAVVSESGQLSLGQGGFMAVGAYTSGILASKAGIPLLATLPLSVAAGAVSGIVVGYLAVRLSGLYLALVTLLFAFAIPELIDYFSSITGGSSGLPMLLPSTFASPLSKMLLCAVLALLATGAFWVANYGSVGLKWRAVRDSENGAASVGLRNTWIRLGAFAFGASLAGLGGSISVMLVGYVSTGGFSVWLSIYVLIALVVGGMRSLAGCALGAAFITLVPFYTGSSSISPDIIYGVLLAVVLLLSREGLAGLCIRLAHMLHTSTMLLGSTSSKGVETRVPAGAAGVVEGERGVATEGAGHTPRNEQLPGTAVQAVVERPLHPDEGSAVSEMGEPASAEGCLDLTEVSAGYGAGLTVRGISLRAKVGECVVLIGPNGAGKSTILRTISRLTYVAAGSVTWEGSDLASQRAVKLASLGIAHVPEGRGIFPELSVRDNLELGLFSRRVGRGHGKGDAISAGLEIFPELSKMLKRPAGTLSGGEQQMVAISRAMVARPRMLLLDEPTLGLSPLMASRVITALKEILTTGIGVLLVEQNLSAALELSDWTHLVVSGEIISTYERSSLHERREAIMKEYLGSSVA